MITESNLKLNTFTSELASFLGGIRSFCRSKSEEEEFDKKSLFRSFLTFSLLEAGDLVIGAESMKGSHQACLSPGEGAQRESACWCQPLQL